MVSSLFSRGKKGKNAPPSPASTPTRISANSLNSKTVNTIDGLHRQDSAREIGEFGTSMASGSRTLPNKSSLPLTPPHSPPPLLPPKYTFLPTHIPAHSSSANSIDSFSYSTDDGTTHRQYGFLGGVGSKITLGVEDVGRIIKDVGEELIRRGLTTPMLFSNQALELNQTRTKMLIQAYLDTLSGRTATGRREAFLRDIQFAKEYELAWFLRWAISRIKRVKEGTRDLYHGVLEWEVYEEWRGRERAAGYPTDAFPFLAVILSGSVYGQVIVPIFHLLSRFAAHSHLSGLTPHALSSLFAPLLFDIPTTVSALTAHAAFVRAAAATEHLLLAYIRSTSSKGSLGLSDLPSRLKEWVSGYPSMVISDADLARGAPRRGARVIRCEPASRTVRAYSRDLVVQAELWAHDLPPGTKWDAWERVTWKARRGDVSRPKFSAAWRRRMMVKENLPLPSSSVGASEMGTMAYGQARLSSPSKRGANRKSHSQEEGEEARWGSLAGKEWSMFEEGGFDAPLSTTSNDDDRDIKKRLQFDLTESAKMGISQKRQTMDWSEFASPSGGFQRTDPLLDVSLTFSAPVESSITDWPKEREELRRRLHKSQKDATPFHYDTSPKIGVDANSGSVSGVDSRGRVYLEEAFVDCWADLMIGSNWIEREELTFREANWALIEYKARPTRPEEGHRTDPMADPRTTDVYFLFEERVPYDYQMAVAELQQKKSFSLFSPKSKRHSGGATGTPESFRAAQIRSTPSRDDSDFDRMLIHRPQTKKVTLTKSASDQPNSSVWHMARDPAPSSPVKSRQRTRSTGNGQVRGEVEKNQRAIEQPKLGESKGSFLSRKTIRRSKTDENARERSKKGQREQEMDFELHSASGVSSVETSPTDKVQGKRNKKDEEKWMDILLANGARRMDRQDVPPPSVPRSQSSHADLGGPMLPDRRRMPPLGPVIVPPPSAVVSQRRHSASESTDNEITPRFSSVVANKNPIAQTPSPADVYGANEPVSPSEEIHFPQNVPGHSSGSTTKLVAPIPQSLQERDTIHSFVDNYGRRSESDDQVVDIRAEGKRHSSEGDNENRGYFDQDHQQEPVDEVAHELTSRRGSVGSEGKFDDVDDDPITTPTPVHESTKHIGDTGVLKSPLPVFDLTPGREPSPSRYRHGEPLHFVGEEPEEEVEEY
ncbi:hypothetical protein CI109_104504 [Kwoniella shandongensis]|uniref:Uncharacterized protein n=1 Tax=Kwoniella shandongensis TaxID=1734106 RepID=A0A5M6BTA9_9TREE|nr:uncharacterized protein CI109_006795 [Kwoniella shandongensis]KAA5524845.1 hypothetical protein CI109_006795 [Kwoniella shandongensis]